jgi:cell division protein FtsW (lipid II flippase)
MEAARASANGDGASSVHAPHESGASGGGAGGEPNVRRVSLAYVLLLLPLVLLVLASWKAVVWGAGCGVVVLATWFTVAWAAAFSARRFYSFELGPFELIEYRGDDADHSKGFLERDVLALPLIWALALWMRGLGFLLILGISLVRIAPLFSRSARGGGGDRTTARDRAWDVLPVALGQVASAFAVTLIASLSENGALAAFALVILVALVSVRAGRRLADQLAASRYSSAPALPMSRILVHLIAPVVLLSPLAVIDMGLLLVMVIPIGAAALLAVAHRLSVPWRLASIGIAAAVVLSLAVKVLHPNVDALRSDDPRVRAERFEQMQSMFGFRFVSLERAAARAVAARDQRAAEELLIAARPGVARDLLAPSIEQVWASRAYAAAGWFGVGLGAAPIGRGIAETVSYAENSYSVYVLHEHGVVGGLAVLFAYLMFAVAVLLVFQRSASAGESVQANRALFLVAALIVTIPAVYVALSNVGIVPITGQNMPFLGLNAWSDVTLCAGIVGMVITGAMRTETRQPRLPAAPATRALAEVA